uniref:Uncharacterized protein n=1 Tax=Neisseria meningitidis alpha153 TaxID=663926 RepID=C6SDD3_NEIME|nr:hypothetical protein predicted by Glimmer/Critica [Neisseria meningitidis alpha153]
MEDEVDGGGKHGAFLKKQTAYFNRLEKMPSEIFRRHRLFKFISRKNRKPK